MDHAIYNTKLLGAESHVFYVEADFSLIKCDKLIADLIFINPPFKKENNFSLFKHVYYDLRLTLKNAFRINQNVILCLPKFAKMEEISELYHDVFEELNL